MRESRNPFRLRAAENIDTDVSFLRLFGPGMLEMLGEDDLWRRPLIIRSAAGGGKTTLLRLLTPQVLLSLYANRALDEIKEVYQRLANLQVVGDAGPKLLGVFLPCTRNYAVLDDLDLDDARKDRLFFGLLSARIALATLQASLELHRRSYPRNLAQITVHGSALSNGVSKVGNTISGVDLHGWATELESAVTEAIDSFEPWNGTLPASLDPLATLELLKPGNLLLDGKPIASGTMLMLDNVHFLTRRQRSTLFRVLAELRSSVAVWLAERLEALVTDELLGSGTQQGRDYEILWIEEYWRSRRPRFEKLSYTVADRRASAAMNVDVDSLVPLLEASLDSGEWTPQYDEVLDDVRSRVTAQVAGQSRFSEWLNVEDLSSGSARERAITWRMLEILIHRDRAKAQKEFEFTLPAEEFDHKSDSQIRAAAELFLAREHKLPYYFGPSRLVSLASSNMEQLLWIAGDMFEEIVSAALVRRSPTLSAQRQDTLLREASDSLWKEIPRRARQSEAVLRFLESVARFCQSMTFRPNAPYDPGVTGIAISMADRNRLLDESFLKRYPHYGQLAKVISEAIANNLVEPYPDYKCKGELWLVLYLNRLLCPRYWLPLHYGGFKEKSLDELTKWLKGGFVTTGNLL